MKKKQARETALLTLPIVGLVIFGADAAHRPPTLRYIGSQVRTLLSAPPAKVSSSYRDTWWSIDVGCEHSAWYKFQKSRYLDAKITYIEDARGTKYFNLKGSPRGSNLTTNYQLKLLADDTYQISYSANLSQIPESAGKLTFKAVYEAQDGTLLPVSFTLRE